MTSILPLLKNIYTTGMVQQPLDNQKLFMYDCYQRMGKQYLSLIISSSLIKSQRSPSNRDVSNALKKLDEDLAYKMRIENKRLLYRIFGKYTYEQLQNFACADLLQLELASMFFKSLQNISKQPASLPRFIPVIRPLNTAYEIPSFSTKQPAYRVQLQNPKPSSNPQGQNQIIQEIQRYDRVLISLKQKIQIKHNTNTDHSIQLNGQQNQDNFQFQLTAKDIQVDNRDYCQQFFINLVAYLKNLSSPQGQLTYIWQHLKWQGFQTFYQPFLNQYHEWTCTARIVFPNNMYPEKCLERTQCSKNKRKARQLACMDLLKSLYLGYPQVWMIYRHLSQEKKLVIAPLEEPKDEDELAIITNRLNYTISKEKIQKVFRHNRTDIKEMMQRISAKAELNTLLQQLPGRVTSPKLKKNPTQGNWSVPVRIQYRTDDHIQRGIPPKVYEKTVTCHNAKIAEQQAYMQAIIQLYQSNPELFEKIQSIKLAKNIKDAQKKVPLLRNLIYDEKIMYSRKICLV